MFCMKCGTELNPDKTVCPGCRFDNVDYMSPPVAASSSPVTAPVAAVNYSFAPPPTPEPYAEGNILVVPRGAALPASCVKCGGAPKDPWLKKTYYWHSPLLYLLIFLGLLIYAIVALIVRKQMQLMLPLCDLHRSARKRKLWIGAILLLACIPVPMALGSFMRDDSGVGIAVLLGLAMFFAGLIVIGTAGPLRPTYIGDDCAKFKGASPEFLAKLKPVPIQAMAGRMPGM